MPNINHLGIRGRHETCTAWFDSRIDPLLYFRCLKSLDTGSTNMPLARCLSVANALQLQALQCNTISVASAVIQPHDQLHHLIRLKLAEVDSPSAELKHLFAALPNLQDLEFHIARQSMPTDIIEALATHPCKLRRLRARGIYIMPTGSRPQIEWLPSMPDLVSAWVNTGYLPDRPILVSDKMRELEILRTDDFHAGWSA